LFLVIIAKVFMNEINSNTMDESVSTKVAQLEARQDGLHKDVKSLADMVGELGRDMRDSMEAIQSRVNEHTRTSWPVIFQGMVVMLALLGFVGSFYVRDLSKLEKRVIANGVSILKMEANTKDSEILLLEKIHNEEVNRLKQKIKGLEGDN